MLHSLCLKDVTLSRHLHAEFAPRLNVLTGDNGLGKTVVLDVAWWALTGSWAGPAIVPVMEDGHKPSIDMKVDQAHDPLHGLRASFEVPPMSGRYDGLRQGWQYRSDGWTDAVVLYVQVDGSFALWDPARHVRLEDDEHDLEIVRSEGQRFDHQALWDGLKDRDRVVCRGLIDDWVTWQSQRDRDPHRRFDALARVLDTLSPHPGEWMRPGEPRRVFVNDARDFPTVETPYGTVPVVHASAAMKRILGLAYLLVWAWNEHREASQLRGTAPAKRMVVLCDEVETHLHPQWQRRIMPSLLKVVTALGAELDVQLLVTTHSPLVLASLEPVFEPERDKLFLLELDASREVVLGEVAWAKRGDAQRWLTSELFGLHQTRSLEAEAAVEAAYAYMRGALDELPAGLDTRETIDAALRSLLPAQDAFWARWVTHQDAARP